MTFPWIGAATPTGASTFDHAARALGCDVAALRAIWEVEAAGKPFRRDRTLERRFEPHKMPGSRLTWRDSLKIPFGRREALFAEAFAEDPDAALRASSWGGPQIMGFNCVDAGFATAELMVRTMAETGDAQVLAFVSLIQNWNLVSAIRAHDWVTFARRYNGTGQADVYARKIEAAFRRHAGRPSVEILRRGDTGERVRQMQKALGIPAHGEFDRLTEARVEAFQESEGLVVDGLVGTRTWTALAALEDVTPPTKALVDATDTRAAAKAGGTAIAPIAALEAGRRILPETAFEILSYGLVALILGAVAVVAWRALREGGFSLPRLSIRM